MVALRLRLDFRAEETSSESTEKRMATQADLLQMDNIVNCFLWMNSIVEMWMDF